MGETVPIATLTISVVADGPPAIGFGVHEDTLDIEGARELERSLEHIAAQYVAGDMS